MVIERRKLQPGLGAGNFGSAGTPIGITRATKSSTPNLGGLLKSLGIAGKEIAENQQKENVTSAEVAIRQAHLDTEVKIKDPKTGKLESHDAHRQRQFDAVSKVREEFKDQSIFMQAFTNENKAVKAIDSLNGRKKALETRGAIAQLMHNMKEAPLEERQKAMVELMQSESTLLGSVSEASKLEFLRNINDFATQMDDKITAESSERVMKKAKLQAYNVNRSEIREMIDGVAGIRVEDSLKSEANFEQMQKVMGDEGQTVTNPDGTQSFNVNPIRPKVIQALEDVWTQTHTHTGSKDQATQAQADLLIDMANTYNSPELIDLAKNLKQSNGQSLHDFHGKRLDEAKLKADGKREQVRRQLREQDRMVHNRSNKAMFDEARANALDMTDDILENPTDVGGAQDALSKVDSEIHSLRDKRARGDLDAFQYTQLLSVQKAAKATLVATGGKPGDTEEFEQLVFNGGLTHESYASVAAGLSVADKKLASRILRKQDVHADREEAFAFNARQQLRVTEIEIPTIELQQGWSEFVGSNQQVMKHAAKPARLGVEPLVPFDMKGALRRLDLEKLKISSEYARENGGRGMPSREMNEALEPLRQSLVREPMAKYKEKLAARDMAEEQKAVDSMLRLEEYKGDKPKVEATRAAVKAATETSSFGLRAPYVDAKGQRLIFDAVRLDALSDNPAEADKAFVGAFTSMIRDNSQGRTKPNKIHFTDAISNMLQLDPNLDFTSSAGKSMIADALRGGYTNTDLRVIPSKDSTSRRVHGTNFRSHHRGEYLAGLIRGGKLDTKDGWLDLARHLQELSITKATKMYETIESQRSKIREAQLSAHKNRNKDTEK